MGESSTFLRRVRLMTLRSACALAFCCLAPALAGARTWVLPAGGGASAEASERPAAWGLEETPGRLPAVGAAGHSLSPRVEPGATTRFELALPGDHALAVTALSVGSADSGRRLAPGLARPVTDELLPEQLLLEGSWHGVDERFELRPQELKHELQLHPEALTELGGGELRAEWLLEAPADVSLALEGESGVVLRDAAGAFLARVPQPLIADGADHHWQHGLARWELEGAAPAWTLALVVDRRWVDDPARAFPLRLDPSFSLQPLDDLRTGFVDEFGQGLNGSIDSGSLEIIFSGGGPTDFFGRDCRGFAEFDTSSIPDGSRVLSVRLQVWLSNHDNPGREIIESPVQPLQMQVKQALVQPTAAPAALTWMSIGGLDEGPVYADEVIPETGPVWCPDSYVFRDYDLGTVARNDLEALLLQDFFTVGFVSEVGVDVGFDHIDYVGFPETGLGGFSCPTNDLPGSRITLLVETDSAPVCDAGGPYLSDCPSEPVLLDGSASMDPDGEPFEVQWQTDCAGTIVDPASLVTELLLDPSCAQSCTATLTLTQDFGPTEDLVLVSCMADVDAADLTPPELIAPDDLTQDCPPALSEDDWLALAIATDSCSDSSVEAVELSRETGCGGTFSATWQLTAVDACGNASAPVVRTYAVVDEEPPVVMGGAVESVCLWPPRHDGFVLGDPAGYVEAVDACSEVSVEWLGCVSDQPDEAREEGRPENGDGHFENDCEVLDGGAALRVRVERAGNDPDGRTYGLLVRVADECGNEAIVEGVAFVPHDRRGGSGGQDDPCLRGDKRK